jgi:ribosome-binding factor A
MNFRHDKLQSKIQELAASFLAHEASPRSLITVTGLELAPDNRHGTILLSVYPKTEERAALGFARRKRGELKHYIYEHLRVGHLPELDFALDLGEAHRQRIDELVQRTEVEK